MIQLQKICFPQLFDGTSELYFRTTTAANFGLDQRPIVEKRLYSFDTYFNMFSFERWRYYTFLDNVFLFLRAKGNCVVRLYGLNSFNIETLLSEHALSNQDMSEVVLHFPDTDSQMLYWTLEAGDDFIFDEAWYCTDVSDDKIGSIFVNVIICTFRREEYIHRNLLVLEKFISDHPDFGTAIRVSVVDNGRTLKQSDMPQGAFTLYPNDNTGGSGGFARGMVEAMKHGGASLSHVLLMDDDITLQAETLIMTISFLRLIRPEFRESILGGAMLNMEEKCVQHESQAFVNIDRYGLHNVKPRLLLTNRYSCLYNDLPIEFAGGHAYQGWWYCVIPMCFLRDYGLPYPFFLRKDDVEFSLRIPNNSVIYINGICVWHEPFYKKSSAHVLYFKIRNSCVMYSVHMSPSRIKLIFYTLYFIIRALFAFDYRSAISICNGIKDYLKGPSFFKNPNNCLASLEKQTSLNEKYESITLLHKSKCAFRSDIFQKHRLSIIQKFFCLITLNGHLLPPSLRRHEIIFFSNATTSSNFFLRRSVVIINPFDETFVRREASFVKLCRCLWHFSGLCLRILYKYNSIRNDYINSHKIMTSLVFWEEYLGLKNSINKIDDRDA